MKDNFYLKRIPRTRIATFDVYAIGLQKHHVSALLEFDVTEARKKLRDLRKNGTNISLNGWIIKVIGHVLEKHPEAAAFLYNKRKLIIFNDINVSVLAEKNVNGKKVPIPVLIKEVNTKSALEITREIETARKQELSGQDIVIHEKPKFIEKMYFYLPGFLRRAALRFLLDHPKIAFSKMGNVVVTSVGMMGKINGWFIHSTVHPLSFGIGSVLKKPVAADNDIKIREILNMTILVDHDVIDGAPMVKLLNDFTESIEKAKLIDTGRG